MTGRRFGSTPGLSNANANFLVGLHKSGAQEWDGLLDDVRIYNRALSPAEIQQLYKLGTVIIRP